MEPSRSAEDGTDNDMMDDSFPYQFSGPFPCDASSFVMPILSPFAGESCPRMRSPSIVHRPGLRHGAGSSTVAGTTPWFAWVWRTALTAKERMLAAMRGQPVDRIPWAPRMDLWMIALRARKAIPPRFAAAANTVEISRAMGTGCHAVRADYTLSRAPAEMTLRGFGVDNHPDYPFSVVIDDLPVEFSAREGNLRTSIRTPAGTVVTHLEQSAEMTRNGISLPFVKEYPIKSVSDFEAVGAVFEHMKIVPTPEAYRAFHRRIGDEGVAVANGPLGASPLHLLLHDLCPMDLFFYLYADERKALRKLAGRIEPFFESMLDAVCASSAEVCLWGANYDRDLTWPPFFREEIAPWLRRAAERLHRAGKLLLTHTDGENHGLLPLYPEVGFDVAESVCPAPMTRLSLAQIREGMGKRIAVWGGIPSVALLPRSMDERSFESYLDGLFASLGDGRGLILGVSDNVPPDADLGRMERIAERIERFGPAGRG